MTEIALFNGVMTYTNNPEYVGSAKMLAEEQTLENLQEFGLQLKDLHDRFIVPEGVCDCDPAWWDQWVANLPDDEEDEEDDDFFDFNPDHNYDPEDEIDRR